MEANTELEMLDSGDFLNIDLEGLEIENIELFLQEGSRGGAELAASCGSPCCSCCTVQTSC